MIFVYPIGVPLYFSYLLYSQRNAIKYREESESESENDNLAGLTFLFENYKPDCWYFEIVVTVIRLMLTGVMGVVESGSALQLFVGSIVVVCVLVLFIVKSPYVGERINLIAVIAYANLLFVLLTASMLKTMSATGNVTGGKRGALIGGLLITGSFLALVVSALMGILWWLKRGGTDAAKVVPKEEEEKEESKETELIKENAKLRQENESKDKELKSKDQEIELLKQKLE